MSKTIGAKHSAVNGPDDLPPPRDKGITKKVDPPLYHVSLNRFFYYLALFAVALSAFYTWRLVQWKSDVGGWWNLALGRRPPVPQSQPQGQWAAADAPRSSAHTGAPSVESRIDDLAAALGVPSKDLAAAIAGAIREHVPPASLSSVAAHETGAARYLVDPSSAASVDAEGAPGATASRGYRAIASAFEAAVGMDDPPSEMLNS
ncbi:hypothetical protein B0H21DRAFT_693183 [Amylocystis lapponica]|nr:hypothetical protein B0H21DRAFT_693183 [Amylocystis lapponica]